MVLRSIQRAHPPPLLAETQAGSKPSPVFDQIVHSPNGEDSVHHEQPLIDDAMAGPNFPASILLDRAVLGDWRVSLGGHRPPPVVIPAACWPLHRRKRRWQPP